ncbi:hypothetical protein RHMOL_Rhmol07G0252300 [Rhododendron molle]|uniref:Uncharacterized protein n=1 Tax=Rhododendron molle TaxID=49168 RepID=A0ACC0N5B4_RHOML|nr:hypothetical protein RHMOL_Rhmol07G0252300 [Rhododendron molle]
MISIENEAQLKRLSTMTQLRNLLLKMLGEVVFFNSDLTNHKALYTGLHFDVGVFFLCYIILKLKNNVILIFFCTCIFIFLILYDLIVSGQQSRWLG